MDLFTILLFAAFILLPILEQVAKRRQQQGPPGSGRPGAGRPDASQSSSSTREEPRSAAEMLPDDLWELMTGERRSSGGEQAESGGSPWSVDPGVATETAEAEDRAGEPWVMDDEAQPAAEYTGPEAYSLETPAPAPVERKVPTAAARHRAFHEMIERKPPAHKRRLSPLMTALRNPDGLRQAVLLKEILGPPKGLE